MQHESELACPGIEMPDPATLTLLFADGIGLVPAEAQRATL